MGSTESKKRLVAVPVLTALLASVAFSGVAVAEPRIFVTDAALQDDVVLVGENATVEVELRNTGDRGAYTVDVTADGSVVASERVIVESGEYETVEIDFAVDSRGVHEIRAEDKNAGNLNVTRVRTATVDERDDGRTVLVEAAAVDADDPLRAQFPESGDATFAVTEVATASTGSHYNRSVTTHAPATGAPFTVPDGDAAALVGTVSVDAVKGAPVTSVSVTVPRAAISDAGLTDDGVTVYRETDDGYEPLETDQVATSESTVEYRAGTDGGERFLVGSLSPSVYVQNRSLNTETTASGKAITVTATLANDGYVDGEFTARLRVDGSVVDTRTVTVADGESTDVTLEYTVVDEGAYDVALNGQPVGSVVVTSDGAATQTAGEETSAGADSSGDGSEDPGLPALPGLADAGLFELGIGAAVVLLGGGVLLALRR